jgi:hypothetical protein
MPDEVHSAVEVILPPGKMWEDPADRANSSARKAASARKVCLIGRLKIMGSKPR